MPNNEQNLSEYDLAVIGGGIAGAAILRDAALRGMRAILFEKNTFGSATSAVSSRLIHGGIRYLELAWNALCRGNFYQFFENFKFVFVSLREARTLERIAPHLAKPIPLLIPVYRDHARGLWTIFAGAWVYHILARCSGPSPRPRLFRRPEAVLKILPELNPEGLVGAIQIWDRLTDDHALVVQTLASAVQNGARALEHARVSRYTVLTTDPRMELQVENQAGSSIYRAHTIVNATGPWLDLTRSECAGSPAKETYLIPIAGSHLMFKSFASQSVLLQSKDNRIFFVIQTGEFSRIGTTERTEANPDTVKATEAEIDYLLENTRRYFPCLSLKQTDIVSTDAGIRPLARPSKPSTRNKQTANEISREHRLIQDHIGVFHLAGVKLTDHRRAAQGTVDSIMKQLAQKGLARFKKSSTARIPLNSA